MKDQDKKEIEDLKLRIRKLELEKWMWQKGLVVWLIIVLLMNIIAIFTDVGKYLSVGLTLILLIMTWVMKKRGENGKA